ncbi:MAG: hypothetical protein WC628_05870 [Candidatus Omnitrophota bacterium]
MFFLKANKIIGLDTDDANWVACELTRRGSSISAGKTVVCADIKEIVSDAVFRGTGVMINLPAQAILFRSFAVAPTFLSGKDRQKNILNFLTRQNLPFKLDDCYWDTFIAANNLNFIAVKNEVAQRYVTSAKEAGLDVLGVTASFVAQYNAIIHNYPDKVSGRFVALNIKSVASELLIYENRRISTYPLSIGFMDLKEAKVGIERFTQEIQGVFNAHYLHNPAPLQQQGQAAFYISGRELSQEFFLAMKNVLSTFEIIPLDPFKRTGAPALKAEKEAYALAVGLGVTYLNPPACLGINFIKAKVRQEQFSAQQLLAKKFSLYLLMGASACLVAMDIAGMFSLKTQVLNFQKNRFQISTVLPKVKELQQQREKLLAVDRSLQARIYLQGLHLKALAVVGKNRPKAIVIETFESQTKGRLVKVALSGHASEYEEINTILSALRKDKGLKEVKVVTPTLASGEEAQKEIEFKLYFMVKEGIDS